MVARLVYSPQRRKERKENNIIETAEQSDRYSCRSELARDLSSGTLVRESTVIAGTSKLAATGKSENYSRQFKYFLCVLCVFAVNNAVSQTSDRMSNHTLTRFVISCW